MAHTIKSRVGRGSLRLANNFMKTDWSLMRRINYEVFIYNRKASIVRYNLKNHLREICILTINHTTML